MMNDTSENGRSVPTRRQAMIFRGKSFLLQSYRFAVDAKNRDLRKHRRGRIPKGARLVASSISDLWTETDPNERELVAGKIQNLRVAVRRIDGITVPAHRIFSFWKQVGRASQFRGFVDGRELREGCIIPTIGGGLCQLSNALYDAAQRAGFEILERHSHTRVIEGSLAEIGRDATVFWNYIDLRFRSRIASHIKARLTSEKLKIEIFTFQTNEKKPLEILRRPTAIDVVNSCATCGVDECHRVVNRSGRGEFGRTAFLVDEFWPEYDEYITDNRTKPDTLMIPVDGDRLKRANYAWSTDGFARVHQSVFTTAVRSYTSRKLAAQGAARQKNLLESYRKLAGSYARRLTHEHLHVVLQQNLLPFLWNGGHLGGRTFDVFMTALPMQEIQRRLDRAHILHPESNTLADFRADEDLLDAETEALANARKIITPHAAVAELFDDRSELIYWQMPFVDPKSSANQKPVIVFPSTTVGRKGCYELREAMRGLDVRLLLMGPIIESRDFWNGFDVTRETANWLELADLVVLPAFIEHKPRRLLQAAAAGKPVIVSDACGVSNIEGVVTVTSGDAVMLRDTIRECLDKKLGGQKQLKRYLISQSIGSEANF